MARLQASRRPDFGQTNALRELTSFSGGRQIYGLGLLLLLVLFVMIAFRGRAPRALERAFATPPQVSEKDTEDRRATVLQRLEGAWYDPPDNAPFLETPGYQRLLRMLTDHVRPGDVVADPPRFDREGALRAADMQRSDQFVVRGVVNDLWAEKLDTPIFQLTDVWRVVLNDGDGEDGIVVDLVEKPPAVETRRETVEVRGYFYRLVRFENKAGKRVTMPYLVARNMTVVPGEQRAVLRIDDPAMLLVMLGIIAMVVWGLLRVVASRPRRPTVKLRSPHLS